MIQKRINIINYELSNNIDKVILEKYNILPLEENELFLIVGTTQPNQNIKALVKIFNKPIKLQYIDEKLLSFELRYLDIKIKLFLLTKYSLQNIDYAKDNSYIIEFIDIIIDFCIKHKASDIHFETLEDSLIVRLRIDGELTEFFKFDKKIYLPISSIIKYFGNLDISQRRMPLNGRFSTIIKNITYDIRISTLPTIYGESIVLRILNNQNITKNIENIGFDENVLKIIKSNIYLTQGLILVTGPTGSGKTTTLYSILHSLNHKNKKIITIEDPVEYKIDGIMQVGINNDINLTYHTILKNILRQDPDILLIGEIRDAESLKIALQASLTGHLVIATLHTNNSLETITRLLELDAKPYLIASTLKMILSQRLLRVLCPKCKVYDNKLFFKSKGCVDCNFTGYQDRQVVCEVLNIDKKISNMIATNCNIHQIEQYAQQNGFVDIKTNAMQLIKNGITTYDEYYTKL
jgi:general secretion pathway protein E